MTVENNKKDLFFERVCQQVTVTLFGKKMMFACLIMQLHFDLSSSVLH
jgi:hypothetical protein